MDGDNLVEEGERINYLSVFPVLVEIYTMKK